MLTSVACARPRLSSRRSNSTMMWLQGNCAAGCCTFSGPRLGEGPHAVQVPAPDPADGWGNWPPGRRRAARSPEQPTPAPPPLQDQGPDAPIHADQLGVHRPSRGGYGTSKHPGGNRVYGCSPPTRTERGRRSQGLPITRARLTPSATSPARTGPRAVTWHSAFSCSTGSLALAGLLALSATAWSSRCGCSFRWSLVSGRRARRGRGRSCRWSRRCAGTSRSRRRSRRRRAAYPTRSWSRRGTPAAASPARSLVAP